MEKPAWQGAEEGSASHHELAECRQGPGAPGQQSMGTCASEGPEAELPHGEPQETLSQRPSQASPRLVTQKQGG